MNTAELTRWNPFEELRLMRNWLDRGFQTEGAQNLPLENLPLDVFERNGSVVVKAALPGVDKKDVDITVADDVLRIRAERSDDKEVKKDDYYLREYATGTYTRAVRLPPNLDTAKADAAYENGMLTLTFPKKAEAKDRSIHVKVH